MILRWRRSVVGSLTGLVAGSTLVGSLAGCRLDTATPASSSADVAIVCASGTISGQGSSAQANAVNTWIRTYQTACPDAVIEYDSVGSGAGIRAFIAGSGDFAGSDAALSQADQPRADARCDAGQAIHLPMVVGPIAVAYTIAGVESLQLRPATLARIFSGGATRWNDAAISADNPGVNLPPTAITTVHRSDSSGTTDSFTRFLSAAAASAWTFGSGTAWQAPGGTTAQGNGGVAATIARTDGAIGYVEWSYAQAHNLRTARIGNAAGEFAALSTEAAGQAVADAEVAGTGNDLRLRLRYDSKASGTYPIVLVTYEIVCSKGTRAAALDLVRGFLTYASGEAGQAVVTRLGYSPLPERLRARVATAVAGLS